MHLNVLTWLSGAMGLLAAAGVPAHAQDSIDPALDQLIAAGQNPGAALAEAARQQAEGDLLGAAATLERALVKSPAADAVRIEYVAVLCLLDDRGSARLELDLLQNRFAAGPGWGRMKAACGEGFVGTRRRTGQFNASLAAGLAYDSNAAEQLTSFEVFGSGSRSGLAAIGSAQIDARIPAGTGFVYGNAFALTHNSLSGADNEYQFGQAALGLGKEFGSTGVSAGPVIRHGRLFGASHVTAYGGQARLARQLGNAAQIVAAAEVVHEDYSDSTFDGTHYDLTIGYDLTSVSLRRYFLGIGIERKTTATTFADYTGFRLAGSLEHPLGSRGAYLNASATLRRIVFDQEPGVDQIKQWRLYSRLALGIPLKGQSLFVEPAITYRRRDYNAAAGFLIDYSSLGGELRLVWKL